MNSPLTIPTVLILLLISGLAPAQFPQTYAITSVWNPVGIDCQEGVTIDLATTSGVVIDRLDVHLEPGVWDIEVWFTTQSGAAVTYPGPWTMLGSHQGLVSTDAAVPTPLPVQLNAVLASPATIFATRGILYLTCSNGSAFATQVVNGANSIMAQQAVPHLEAREGEAFDHAFGTLRGHRRWFGTIHFHTCGFGTSISSIDQPPYQPNTLSASLDHDGIGTNGCAPAVIDVAPFQLVQANIGTSLLGLPHDALINYGVPQIPRSDPGAIELSDGQVFNIPVYAPGTTWFYGGVSPGFMPGANFSILFGAPPGPIQWTAQIVFVDPTSPSFLKLSAANTVRVSNSRAMVEAVGPNSFNAITTSGFWRITNLGSDPIKSVTFDWVNSSNPAQATMEFHTSQTAMADRFDGGFSTATGCLGTYRNGSALTTGLTTGVSSPCNPSVGTGYVPSWATVNGQKYRMLKFSFAPGAFTQGEVLEFDCDTDGGAGPAGDDMEGLVVTIEFASGPFDVQATGELVAEPGTQRSFVVLGH